MCWRVRIPLRWAQKRKAPIAGSLSNQWWAMRDVRVRLAPPASASGLRPSRAALENASRFLSSAPWRVRIPCAGPKQKTVPLRGPFPIQWWAMRDVACGWRRPHPLRRSAPRVLRWKTLRVSSAPHPGGFESHEMGANKTVPLRGPFPIQWWAMRDSNPQPCACKAPALTVAPIARAERV